MENLATGHLTNPLREQEKTKTGSDCPSTGPVESLVMEAERHIRGVEEANLPKLSNLSNLSLSLGKRRRRSESIRRVQCDFSSSVPWHVDHEVKTEWASNPCTVPGTFLPSIKLTVPPEGHDTHTPLQTSH